MFILYVIVALILLIYFKQEKLLLKGEKINVKWKPFLDFFYEEVYLPVKQGKKNIVLHGVIYKAKAEEKSKGIIIYYHGNKGNLDSVGFNGLTYLSNGYDMAMLDYRGFGKSEGTIVTPEMLLEDAVFFYDEIIKLYKYETIVIVGKSLGTGLATYVASQRKSNLLMLITPYDKLYKVAQNKYNWLPTGFLFKYLIPSIDWLSKINIPIRIIHGTRDDVIFPERAESYYLKAKELNKDVDITWLKGALHNNLENYVEYHKWIKDCLEKVN